MNETDLQFFGVQGYSERLAYAFIGLHKNVPPCDSQVANDIWLKGNLGLSGMRLVFHVFSYLRS